MNATARHRELAAMAGCLTLLVSVFGIYIISVCAQRQPAPAGGTALDLTVYYRLSNDFLGTRKVLDLKPDNSGELMMAAPQNVSGQAWKLVALGNGRYALRSAYLGDGFSLDLYDHGQEIGPRMAETNTVSGQFWSLTPWGDGSFKFGSDFTGPDKSLDTHSGSPGLFLGDGNHSGQHWRLTPIDKVAVPTPIPALDAKGNNFLSLGPTDRDALRSIGTVKAVMIFVDFSNAQGTDDPAAVAKHLLGNGQVQQLFKEVSHGKLDFRVDVRANLGWRRMPKPSSGYFTVKGHDSSFDDSDGYIKDAAALFNEQELNFSAYQVVLIVASKMPEKGGANSCNQGRGHGYSSPSGEFTHAVVFRTDSYDERYIALVHEIGHSLGLPDLYRTGDGDQTKPKSGSWSIMCDVFHSVSFLGWERHKLGWLEAPRKTYIAQDTDTWSGMLSPLPGKAGLSMIVLPVDDAQHPSKVLVIELAQAVLGVNNQRWGSGVLLYTVDATVPSGRFPVELFPKKVSSSPDYGYLYEAPYGVGDTISKNLGKATVTVKVMQKFGSSYFVQIGYHRR